MSSVKTDIFWQRFLAETGRDGATMYVDCYHFCATEELANKLLALVLNGQKRATSAAVAAYEAEGEPLPRVGNLSIVTDWNGNPGCVIETTAVTLIPYNEMTFEICKREGEDDTLESWQAGHRTFFTEDASALGYEFTEDMLLVFEDFRVVYEAEDA